MSRMVYKRVKGRGKGPWGGAYHIPPRLGFNCGKGGVPSGKSVNLQLRLVTYCNGRRKLEKIFPKLTQVSYVKNGIQKGKSVRIASLRRSLLQKIKLSCVSKLPPPPPLPWASIVERAGYPPGKM